MLQKNNTPDIARLLRDEPDRLSEMVVEEGRWRFDASRTTQPLGRWRSDRESAALAPLAEAIEALFRGEVVNPSENRPALHMALRADDPASLASGEDARRIARSRQLLMEEAGRLYRGEGGIRTILHAGIGGSDLGPRLVADALDPGDGAVQVQWLTTLDARRLRRLLQRLDPATTALVVASKSFGTVETLTQARAIRDWLGDGAGDRIWAATARPEKAAAFGIRPDRVLDFPEWTGGRFSLWSSVGFSAAARIGPARWEGLLAGASRADASVRQALRGSIAASLARVVDGLVRRDGFGTLGVVSYEPRLRLLAEYLQQLVMESLGKGVRADGEPVDGPTSPLVFGGAGTDLQHSLFQALHQGTTRHPMLLLGSLDAEPGYSGWASEQLAHLLGQASVLVSGREAERAEQRLPGNNPVMLLLARRLDAAALGELLATFEHAVYLLGVLWRINPFDQWGVEEGKRLAEAFRSTLEGKAEGPDPTLAPTLRWIGAEPDEG